MAKITPSAFFEVRPHDDSVLCADKTSFLENDTTISLILPYFNLKQLVHAEIFNRRFHNNIIKFYFRMENFSYMSHQQPQVQGFIDKIWNRSPNIKRLEVGWLNDMKPLSKLNYLKKLHSILFHGSCPEIEFQSGLILLKSIVHQLRVLDLSSSYFLYFNENDITNGHFLNDFVLLEELRLADGCGAYLPNVTLPKLLILQYCYIPDKQNLLLQFCQQNSQIEQLYIIYTGRSNTFIDDDNLLFPGSSLAFLRNLHVLHVQGRFSINGDLAKQFVDYNHNLADLAINYCKFQSDEALQMIYDALRQSLVKLELNEFSVNSVEAIRGIRKLQNLQHLKICYPEFSMDYEDDHSISIKDFLNLKALRFLHIGDIQITFDASSACKFQSLDELVTNNGAELNSLLGYCTNRLTKFTISSLPTNANESFIQLSNKFTNLTSLCIYLIDEGIIVEETADIMSHNLANLKLLDVSWVFSLPSLISFFKNCKCLATIICHEADHLKNHPVIKDARNCGRYIDIY